MLTLVVPGRRGHDHLLTAAALVVRATPLARLRTVAGEEDKVGCRNGMSN